MRSFLFAPAAVLVLLLSGCTAPGEGLFAGPTGIPEDAPSEIGDGDTLVQVMVVQEFGGGQPIPGAPIVIHELPKPHQAPSVQELRRVNATLGGRAGPDGILRAHLDMGKTYSFLTEVSNWTPESRHLVKITQEHATNPIVITVFRPMGQVEMSGKVPVVLRPEVPFFSGLSSSPKMWLQEVRFHPDNASNRQYLFRLRSLQGAMIYSLPPGAHANIQVRAVLFSDDAEPMLFGGSYSTLGSSGPQNRPIQMYPWEIANIHRVKNPVLKIGPMTYESVVSPECIPFQIRLEASFDHTPLPPARRPFFGVGPDNTIAQAPFAC